MKFSRAFTLVELLVVIAIIAILSAIVLASLDASRTRGKDAAIKANLNQMIVQGELFFETHQRYSLGSGGGEDSLIECTNPTNASFIIRMKDSLFDPALTGNINNFAVAAGNNAPANLRAFCRAVPGSWAYAVALNRPEAGTTGWCVDSSRNSYAVDLNFGAAGTPLNNGTAARCP